MKGIAIRLGIIAIIAVGRFLLRDRIAGNAGDLRVGDCFDAPTTQGVEVKDVAHHPCNEPHTAEVVLVRDYSGSGDAYPSDPATAGELATARSRATRSGSTARR